MIQKGVLINTVTRVTAELTGLYRDLIYQLGGTEGRTKNIILDDASAHIGKTMEILTSGLNKSKEIDEQS